MKPILFRLIITGFLFFLSSCEQVTAENTQINKSYQGLAIYGFDPVAYFLEKKPVKGALDFRYSWKGASWHFSSDKNRQLFKNDPEKYVPQFGGYCAYAVSQNTLADIDPGSWDIVDGKLYLNLNKEVQQLWQNDRDTYIKSAHANWPGVLKKK